MVRGGEGEFRTEKRGRMGEWCIYCLLLCYVMATVLQLYRGSDMMYEVKNRKPKPTLLPTQGIFNLLYHIGTV